MVWPVLLLSPLKKGSGNNSTIQRIRTYLEDEGYTCILQDPGILDVDDIEATVSEHGVKAIIALHAYKSGRLLIDCTVPVILILGGTDIYGCHQDVKKLQVMGQAVKASRYVVAFSETIADRAKALWGDVLKFENKLVIIRQAVMTKPSTFSLVSYLNSEGRVDVQQTTNIFVIVGAIRPVKNPLYLVKEFSEWHSTRPDVLLVIIGPEFDASYQKEFLDIITGLSGVIYIPGLSPEDTHAAIKESFALVNTSDSEGMAAVILEAMQMNVPVLARDNDGNKSLIQDGVNGYLFNSQKEFLEKAEHLLEHTDVKENLISNACTYMTKFHSTDIEQDLYIKLLKDIEPSVNL